MGLPPGNFEALARSPPAGFSGALGIVHLSSGKAPVTTSLNSSSSIKVLSLGLVRVSSSVQG